LRGDPLGAQTFMQLKKAVVVLALLGSRPGWAGTPEVEPLPRGRLELRGGLGARDDQLSAAEGRVNASGSAVSELVAGGAWFAGGGPFGGAARLEMEQFSVRSDQGATLRLSGWEVGGGAAGRLSAGGGRLTVEGLLGYTVLQVPLAQQGAAGAMPIVAVPLTAHGPVLGATLALAVNPWIGLEAGGRLLPVTFGGERGGQSLPLRRLAARAGASLGRLDRAGMRWSGLLLYELGRTAGDAGAVNLSQTRQQVSIGVRATFRTVHPAPALAAVVATPSPRGRIRGLVLAAPAIDGERSGPPLPGVVVSLPGGPSATTDPAGAFVIEAVPPGLQRLRLSRAGLLPADEVVSVPAEGDVAVEITLRPADGPVPATLVGLVRDDAGAPVAAQVRIVERALEVLADQSGQFRFELPPGRYTLVIEAAGFAPQRKMVRAAPGEANIYNVDLQRER
jgi:hypothetical protein